MSAVSSRDVERLGKLLGLLGSAHEGERANAAALADRQLRALGRDWRWLVERAFAPAPHAPAPPQASDPGARIMWLLSCRGFLSAWELGFVQSIHAQARPLSLKQRLKLQEITTRVEARCGSEFAD